MSLCRASSTLICLLYKGLKYIENTGLHRERERGTERERERERETAQFGSKATIVGDNPRYRPLIPSSLKMCPKLPKMTPPGKHNPPVSLRS
jgi:hypothetical protein